MNYTHQIEFTLIHPTMGEIPGNRFRTTPDALWIHKKVLEERRVKGEIKEYTVTPL